MRYKYEKVGQEAAKCWRLQVIQQRPSPVAGDGDKGADAEGLPQVPGTFCLVRKGVGLG